jgi:hypothetical protein
MQVLDIDRYLGNVKNRIQKAGVEVEGGWIGVPAGERMVVDASVFRPATKEDELIAEKLKLSTIGELTSPALCPASVKGWLKRCYPDMSNQTCGLHVHMSFKNLRDYVRLMVPEYQLTIVAYLKKWANEEGLADNNPIWDRLSGKSEYCSLNFFPTQQIRDRRKDYDHFREGNRYTAIAYRWGTHRTVECRVLPMMQDAAQAWRAIERVFDITNAFLVKVARREERDWKMIEGANANGVTEIDILEILGPDD